MTAAPPQDRARGMLDVALSPQGQAEADHLGRRIAAKGGVHTIVSSPMRRALETAAAIQRHNPQARLSVNPMLEPLHQAGLEGQTHDVVQPAMQHFAQHPEERIPGAGPSGIPGESLSEHARRVLQATHHELKTLHPGEKKLILLHHSGIRAVRGSLKHGLHHSDPSEMASEHDVAKPAGEILRLGKARDGKPNLESNPIESDQPIGTGLNFVRHGATQLNAPSHPITSRLAHRGVLS
jgi:broad specificity phosphatase PhoE